MTIFSSLFFLAREVFNAAVVSRADGFFRGLSDGAELLAEREAQVEVGEAIEGELNCSSCEGVTFHTVSCPLMVTFREPAYFDVDDDATPEPTLPLWPESEAPLIRTGITPAEWDEFAAAMPLLLPPSELVFASGGQTSEMGPRPELSTSGPRVTDSDRLDRIISLLEEIRDRLTPAEPAEPRHVVNLRCVHCENPIRDGHQPTCPTVRFT